MLLNVNKTLLGHILPNLKFYNCIFSFRKTLRIVYDSFLVFKSSSDVIMVLNIEKLPNKVSITSDLMFYNIFMVQTKRLFFIAASKCTMIGNRKFEPFTVWNDIELKYRITASQRTSWV